MGYGEVVRAIEQKGMFGGLPGVEISKKLLAAVGNPQRGLAFVHIAGTNGKGSTAAFLYSVLNKAGIRTGLFTSPHLMEMTERIQANGMQIPKKDFSRLGQSLLDGNIGVQAAMSDYVLAMALLYFREQDCRLAVIETGLGGRLDSTNAIPAPLVSVITKIGYDHTAILGETLSKIASEKAGILKKGTHAVLQSQKPEVMEVLTAQCSALAIPYLCIGREKIVPCPKGFSYPGESPYEMKMLGAFQRENALSAVLAARELAALGYPVTEEALHQGIFSAVWNGRMELVSRKPYVLLDGAHNEDGVKALAGSLQELYPGEKFRFVMGVMADKDYKKMADCILPLAKKVTAVTPEAGRARNGADLAEYIRQRGIQAEVLADSKEIMANADEKGRTVVFGSLYFVGEFRKFLTLSLGVNNYG